jgi:micrococcal nuclease
MAHIKNSLLQVALSIPTADIAADFTGNIVGVINRDTLEVLNGHDTERIRLSGIDCPKKGQTFG